MTFVPHPDKISVRPIKKETEILGDDNLLEMGEVLAVGRDIVGVSVGDTVFFVKYGVFETPEVDGVKYFVVPYTSEYILGKLDVEEK